MRLAIQVVLAIAIVVLAYLLFRAIRDPWVEEQSRLQREDVGRERMDDVRSALISFRDVNQAYPPSLDSLVYYVQNDTSFVIPEPEADAVRFNPFIGDSLMSSARGGGRFNYELVQETDSTGAATGVEIYWLQDPGAPEDSIGTRIPNPAYRNSASWE